MNLKFKSVSPQVMTCEDVCVTLGAVNVKNQLVLTKLKFGRPTFDAIRTVGEGCIKGHVNQ